MEKPNSKKIDIKKGLTEKEVIISRQTFGTNEISQEKQNVVLKFLLDLVKEPMVLLLFVASFIFFISGETGEGFFLLSAIIFISGISFYQDKRTEKASEELKQISQSKCTVIRNSKLQKINIEEIVLGDLLKIEEGEVIAADGMILKSNDLSINESILTGESLAVQKNKSINQNQIYRGTTVATGMCIAQISAIGNETQLGKVDQSLKDIISEKTPLELQINQFVKKMVYVGVIAFLVVWVVNFLNTQSITASLLMALTLAMSILPEEIPIAFSSFMALGAWRLLKMGIITKKLKTVESLGSATVICVDKTGTITKNEMALAGIYTLSDDKFQDVDASDWSKESLVAIETAFYSSEPIPFDPMEKSIRKKYLGLKNKTKEFEFELIHEYPLGGSPPMMTHLIENQKSELCVFAKGALEAILEHSDLDSSEKERINKAAEIFTNKGYRILGLASIQDYKGVFLPAQQDYEFNFDGLIAFYDPPKENIKSVFKSFEKAGIDIKIITGDNMKTTQNIANQIGFNHNNKIINGEELSMISESDLKHKIAETRIFTRMFPRAKLAIINALKANKEIVVMTGDGVNDGPALKAAHVGVAMGKRGTEVAKQASNIILIEDDLSTMLDGIALGRNIFLNLKKAIRYIISIHLPIIMIVSIPLILGWRFPNIFTPVHVIFLELIMGPTCSIVFENEPLEKGGMEIPPRKISKNFFTTGEIVESLIQGFVIGAGALFIYQLSIREGYSENTLRAMVFMDLISANIFLTLVNRSFFNSIFSTLKNKNPLVWIIIGITLLFTTLVLFVPIVSSFFDFSLLSLKQSQISIFIGFVSVIWFEIIKMYKRKTTKILELD